MSKQSQLYSKWNNNCEMLKMLSAYFQNDITDISAAEVKKDINEFKKRYEEKKADLELLYTEIINFMNIVSM